ncbi:MAG: DNA repair protein RecN [Acidimicrobiales bacterium]
MLVELHVRDLGVIDELSIDLGPGMTAITGETGAGKTLVIEALELLVGGRADAALVRPGAEEALVEGRFVLGDDEHIVARAVAAQGRSRAWIDGRMAPVGSLGDLGATLVDLHGQHAHQSLLSVTSQRRALDVFGGIDTAERTQIEDHRRALKASLDGLGGDDRERQREMDLLQFQLDEIEAAGLDDPGEDALLSAEEDRLSDVQALREAAAAALAALDGTGETAGEIGAGALDAVSAAMARLAVHRPLEGLTSRLGALQLEMADVASELRGVVEQWEDDPVRLEQIRSRRQLLRTLGRKYGPDVEAVLAYSARAASRLDELRSAEARAASIDAEIADTDKRLAEVCARIGAARRDAAPRLATEVQRRLRHLAMPGARIEVRIGGDVAGDDVVFGLGANPGEPVLPLAKVASGGELARTMLALRLVCSEAPPTMVFDEVDAGIGGEAAIAVGRALAEVASGHQVLVVTHLAQVAAFATRQLAVTKHVRAKRTVAEVTALQGEGRVVELARMLSGNPESQAARRHAEELLGALSIDHGTGAVV